MGIAALALHELRSAAAVGEHAQADLAATSHGYLGPLAVVIGLLAATAAAHLFASVAIAVRGSKRRRYARRRTAALWAVASLLLLCLSLGQGLLESLAATGDLPRAESLFAHGGWSAIPLAVAFGGGVALAVRGADFAIALAGRAGRRVAARVLAGDGRRRSAERRRDRTPLAGAAAVRAPPRSALAS